jgi:hypothetical protein
LAADQGLVQTDREAELATVLQTRAFIAERAGLQDNAAKHSIFLLPSPKRACTTSFKQPTAQPSSLCCYKETSGWQKKNCKTIRATRYHFNCSLMPKRSPDKSRTAPERWQRLPQSMINGSRLPGRATRA